MGRISRATLQQTIMDYQAAYVAANGKEAPVMYWGNGYFWIGGTKYRRGAVEEMIGRLRERITFQGEK